MPPVAEIKPTPNADVIDLAEDLLSMAKSGEIQAIVYAGVLTNCRTVNAMAGDSHPMHLLGEVEILKRDIVDMHMDTRCHRAGEEY